MKLHGTLINIEVAHQKLIEDYSLYAMLEASSAEKDELGFYTCNQYRKVERSPRKLSTEVLVVERTRT